MKSLFFLEFKTIHFFSQEKMFEEVPQIQLNDCPECYQKIQMKNQDLISIIKTLEESPSKPMTIFAIGHNSCISSKRLYELMNVACAIGACKKLEGTYYIWQGVDKINQRLVELYESAENEGSTKTLKEMFAVDEKVSPTIEELTTKLIKLYFYLGKHSVEINNVVTLFAANGSKSRTILRRLYCISNVLATFRIIDHPHHKAKFIINVNIDELAKRYYAKLTKEIIPENCATLLSQPNMAYIHRIHKLRQKSFKDIINLID